jgi:hypothetical protein
MIDSRGVLNDDQEFIPWHSAAPCSVAGYRLFKDIRGEEENKSVQDFAPQILRRPGIRNTGLNLCARSRL